MKLKHILSSILVSLSWASFSQLNDTISVKSNSFYESFYQDLDQNPLNLAKLKIHDYTQTKVEYNYKKLNFKRRQTATNTDGINFNTQGIYNYSSKLRVFGNFNVSKVLEDDLGFNFSSSRTENQIILAPNYFYAPKAGNWDIQKYNLLGGANYNFDNGIMLGGIVNYKNEKHYRKIDPRPEILVHNITGKGYFGYSYKNHAVNGFIGIGKNTEQAGIMFVDRLLDTPANEETFVRFNSGYGYTSFNSTYNNFMNRGLTNLWGLGYQYKNNKNYLNINYQYSKLIEDLYSKSTTGTTSELILDKNRITHKYRDITHLTQFDYFQDGENVDFKLSGNYKFSKHDNFSVVAQGQNFRYVENSFTLNTGILKTQNNKTLFAVNLNGKYSRNVVNDLLTTVNKKIHYLELSLSGNTDLFKNNKNRINTEVFVKHYSTLHDQLVYNPSGSNTTFSNYVIFNDHGYDVTSKLTTGINVNYDITLKKCDLRLFGSMQSLFALNNDYKKYTTNLINRPNENAVIGIAVIY